jgi:hypothetical protein
MKFQAVEMPGSGLSWRRPLIALLSVVGLRAVITVSLTALPIALVTYSYGASVGTLICENHCSTHFNGYITMESDEPILHHNLR